MGEKADRGDVGVLFVDLLFALVVVELLEPLRRPEAILAEGWMQLTLAFTLTLLSWIGYHLSVSRVDEAVRIDSPPFLHLLLDVLMVALYWLTAISYERVSAEHSWWFISNPSAVPEAAFIFLAFALYVAWDHVSHWIHQGWARRVNARLAAGRPSPYERAVVVWDAESERRWRRRSVPTETCLAATLVVLAVAIIVQTVGIGRASDRVWVIGLDVSLFAIVIGFRTGKEWRSYPNRLNGSLTAGCLVAFVGGLAVPLYDTLI